MSWQQRHSMSVSIGRYFPDRHHITLQILFLSTFHFLRHLIVFHGGAQVSSKSKAFKLVKSVAKSGKERNVLQLFSLFKKSLKWPFGWNDVKTDARLSLFKKIRVFVKKLFYWEYKVSYIFLKETLWREKNVLKSLIFGMS